MIVGLEFFGTLVSTEAKPAETIRIGYAVRFDAIDLRTKRQLRLGSRNDVITWVKGRNGFEIDPRRSAVSPIDFKKLYEDWDEVGDSDSLVRFDFSGLNQIAKGVDSTARRWLIELLKQCSNTPKATELKALLAKTALERRRAAPSLPNR